MATNNAPSLTTGQDLETNDILLWADGFWCFKEELNAKFLRDDSYRTVVCASDEWLAIISMRQNSEAGAEAKS
jgi:hypothetical protein